MCIMFQDMIIRTLGHVVSRIIGLNYDFIKLRFDKESFLSSFIISIV